MDYLNQLPWGFTFSPTDEEVICYLEAKSKNSALPFVDPIIDFDVYTAAHPSQLHMQQRFNVSSTHLYFYVKKSGRGRTAGNGFWHENTAGTKVFNYQGAVIGHRRSLVYYMYDSPLNDDEKNDKVIEIEDKKSVKSSSTKTNWIMNEFRLPDPYPKSKSSSKGPRWTICKIGETGRRGNNIDEEEVILADRHGQPQQQQLQLIDNNYVVELMQFEEQQQQYQFHTDQQQQQWQCDVDNINVIASVPQHASDQVEQPAELLQRPQFDDIEVTDNEFDGYIQQLLESSCDSWPQIEESNNQLQPLLQQSNDDNEDGVPATLWLDETQLGCCDEEGNLLNLPTKRARVV